MNTAWFLAGYAFALAGQLGDCWTTEVALSHGFVEVNKVVNWLTKKVGSTGVTLLKVIGLAQAVPVLVFELTHQDVLAAVIVFAAVGAVGFAAAIGNYLGLRKKNIKL